jgi:hypothetical protein
LAAVCAARDTSLRARSAARSSLLTHAEGISNQHRIPSAVKESSTAPPSS